MANLSTKQIVGGQRLPLGRPNCIQANQRRRGLLYQHDAVEGESCHVVSGPMKASAECDPLAEKVVEHQTDGPRRLCYSLFFFNDFLCFSPRPVDRCRRQLLQLLSDDRSFSVAIDPELLSLSL